MQTIEFDRIELKPGDRVLDLGCGEGRHVISAYLEADVHAVGVDLCFEDVKTTAEKFQPFEDKKNKARQLSLSVGSALELPFAENTFDVVICSEVLEHIPDYKTALEEIRRVLKPNGYFCASVPRYLPEKICWWFSDEYHEVEGGHVRIFKSFELSAEIEALGYKKIDHHWAHALHSPYWWMQCAMWKRKDKSWSIKQYHKLLVWDMMEQPKLTRTTEKLLDPIIGKSVVMYFQKKVAEAA